MKKLFTLSFLAMLLLLPSCVLAQDTLEYYWVSFVDKQGTTGSLKQPSKFLSQRALERRRAQRIAIDSLDLPVSPLYTNAVVAAGARLHNVSKWLNGVCVVADSAVADSVGKLPFVVKVFRCLRRDMTGDTARTYEPGESLKTSLCDVYGAEYYGSGYEHIALSNGIPVHKSGYQGQGVWIGVCDGGFPGVDTLSVFSSLRDEHRLIATRDFVLHRPSVYYAESHGTMVLSNMAANVPGMYVGTAPKASYILCITEDGRSESPVEEINWAAAAEYLDSMGVDVINTSLGYNGFGDTTLSHVDADFDGKTALMTLAAEAAASRGILCVVSAGNSGSNPKHPIGIPADAPHSLTVGAAWAYGVVASFSSWGPTADGRVKPDVMAQGVYTTVASPSGGFQMAHGTSFASPITAGLVACLRGAMPLATVDDICSAIRLSGKNVANVNNHIGYGVPDFEKALMLLQKAAPVERYVHYEMDDEILEGSDENYGTGLSTGGYMGDEVEADDAIADDSHATKKSVKHKKKGRKHKRK